MTDIDDMIREIDQNIEWFCDKTVSPVPLNEQDKDEVMKRMVALGWLRQSEVDTYKEITKDD